MTTGAPDSGEPFNESGTRSCCKGAVPQDMFEILMNGVFAFVMTLIVKNNIPPPSTINAEDLEFIAIYVGQIYSEATNFIFTFALLAVFYILFFEIMRSIRLLDRYFVYISFGFILSIIFIPLTSLLWTYSDSPMPYGVLFHVNILCCGFILYILWRYASRNQQLILPGISGEKVTNITWRLLLFPATALAGLIIDGYDGSYGSIPITELYVIPIIIFVILSWISDRTN
jgi:uncharacterized membrane protein